MKALPVKSERVAAIREFCGLYAPQPDFIQMEAWPAEVCHLPTEFPEAPLFAALGFFLGLAAAFIWSFWGAGSVAREEWQQVASR